MGFIGTLNPRLLLCGGFALLYYILYTIYYTILCNILYYVILYYTTLYYIILYYTIYCTIQHYNFAHWDARPVEGLDTSAWPQGRISRERDFRDLELGGRQNISPLFGYPKYWVPYYNRDPKQRDDNFDNRPVGGRGGCESLEFGSGFGLWGVGLGA